MEFKLPELGEGVHEGELIKWKVKPGDPIGFDQPLCEIMTDKATVEIPSAIKGTVGQLHAKEGEVVHVGQLLLSLEGSTAGASAPQPAAQAHVPAPSAHAQAQAHASAAPVAQATHSAPPAATRAPAPAAPSKAPAAGNGAGATSAGPASIASRVLAAPSTRRLAREQGIDLNSIEGTGPHGRVLREDLSGGATKTAAKPMAAKSSRPAQTGALEERVPFRGLRKKIAEKMRLSKDHATHFTYVEEADATELVALRAQAKEIGAKQGIKVTFLPFVMKAMVAALKQYPILNSSLDEQAGELVYKHYYNIGLSIQTEDGLTAPVVKDVGNKTVWEIASEIQDLVERARAKKLTMDDFVAGTITLTNAGSIGGLFATPIINYPEVAILGFNKIFRKPVARTVGGREEIVVRDWTYFSISLDHRVVDGAIGAEFMKTFIRYIETPALLVLEG
jgi:pyruvate dehydrogenase E2 component (dihydrolipoamide acetyltransferase)